jgi:uncharacterized pyridoxamine 5'-phosphate oxidase family protein
MMNEVYEFLKKCGVYYLATIDSNKPRVRPFGALDIFEGKLYFQTGKIKSVSKQMAANPNIEICAVNSDMQWIRIEAQAVNDDRIEAKKHMLDANPDLKSMYKADDGNTQVLYLKDAIATIASFSKEPKVIKF